MRQMVHQDIPALAIDNVTKCYSQWMRSGKARDIIKNLIHPEKRDVLALDGLTLTVQPGEFVAYAGSNGAGKSTTIKLLSGILQPSSGSIRVLGMNPAKERLLLMNQIGVLFGQRTELWWDHPIITSFEWKKEVWNIPDDVYEKNLAMVTELLDLEDILHTFARELSLGQRMRADIGMLLLHSPSVIFLDEPTLGLDVLAKQQMIRFLKKINEETGTTIIVTSHDMDDLEEMAKRIILLDKGKMEFDGSFEELRAATGGSGRLTVTFRDGAGLPDAHSLPGLRLINSQEQENNIGAPTHLRWAEYEFNKEETGIHEILGLLSHYPDIIDVEIRKAPIEDVIAGLYLSWKK